VGVVLGFVETFSGKGVAQPEDIVAVAVVDPLDRPPLVPDLTGSPERPQMDLSTVFQRPVGDVENLGAGGSRGGQHTDVYVDRMDGRGADGTLDLSNLTS